MSGTYCDWPNWSRSYSGKPHENRDFHFSCAARTNGHCAICSGLVEVLEPFRRRTSIHIVCFGRGFSSFLICAPGNEAGSSGGNISPADKRHPLAPDGIAETRRAASTRCPAYPELSTVALEPAL